MRPRLVFLAAVAAVAVMALAPAAPASARPGTRVTVALFGDSVTESLLVPNFLQYGLAPQLSRAESSLGFVPGGVGLIPPAPFRWHFNAWRPFETGPIPPNGWLTLGFGVTPGYDGPSGYSALAISPLATATDVVSDPDLEILYTSTSLHCPFTVTAAGRTWTIDTFRSGPAIDTETPVTLPPGRHQITIHGPSCGALSFDGVVAQRPVPPGKVQVEVDNLGHSGVAPWGNFGPRIQQSLTNERYNVSVFLYGYIGEVEAGPPLSAPYMSAMLTRAHIAREHGGSCLVVAPTPAAVPPPAVNQVSRLDQTVARRAGCTYTSVLAHLWTSPAVAEHRGLVIMDGIHPTAAGYNMIAHALAPVIAQMVHAHVPGG